MKLIDYLTGAPRMTWLEKQLENWDPTERYQRLQGTSNQIHLSHIATDVAIIKKMLARALGVHDYSGEPLKDGEKNWQDQYAFSHSKNLCGNRVEILKPILLSRQNSKHSHKAGGRPDKCLRAQRVSCEKKRLPCCPAHLGPKKRRTVGRFRGTRCKQGPSRKNMLRLRWIPARQRWSGRK